MEFEPLDFSALNEADVREEIIAPLLRRLGYRSGTRFGIIREQFLVYPRVSLGRRQPRRDPLLRGRADYICDIDGLLRWTIEAKAPTAEIDQDAIDQAYTYANHPEVRAVVFCLTNGVDLKVFQTNAGPDAPALFSLTYSEFESRFSTIERVLAPSALLSTYPRREPDLGEPIGPGLRSVVRITNGTIEFTSAIPSNAHLAQLRLGIEEGSVERVDGRLLAYLRAIVPFQSLHELNERLGLNEMTLKSESGVFSTVAQHPTVFESYRLVHFAKGDTMLDISTMRRVQLPSPLALGVRTSAEGWLQEREFAGRFGAAYEVGGRIFASVSGRFSLSLA